MAVEDEIENYTHLDKNPQFEYGLLTYLTETTIGDLNDLVTEVGISPDTMNFMNVGDFIKKQD